MAQGRRKKGPDTFPENWKEIMLECGRKGLPNSCYTKQLDLSHTTHNKIKERDEEYRKVYQEYLLLHETWWLDQVKEALEKQENIDARLFQLMMGNKQRKRWKRNEDL